MINQIRRVFLPAGVVIPLYALYGGNSKDNKLFSIYDMQLLVSYLEFYFNYSKFGYGRGVIYKFDTLPQFYMAKINEDKDYDVLSSDSKILYRFVESKLEGNSDQDQSELYNIAKNAFNLKKKLMEQVTLRGVVKEIDKSMAESARERGVCIADSLIDYNNASKMRRGVYPANPYLYALIDGETNFQVRDLYSKTSNNGDNRVFARGEVQDFGSYYVLKKEQLGKNMDKERFSFNETEIIDYLKLFFDSDCYKLIGNKNENFAPSLETFLNCFKCAIKAFDKINLLEVNNQFSSQIESVPKKTMIEVSEQ